MISKELIMFFWGILLLATIVLGNDDGRSLLVTNSIDGQPGSLRFEIEHAKNGNTITFSLSADILEVSSPLTVTKSLTIDGTNKTTKHDITVTTKRFLTDKAKGYRLFKIDKNADSPSPAVTIKNIILGGGDISDSSIVDGNGGAILVASGNLNLINSKITDSKAQNGGAIYCNTGTNVEITSTEIDSNYASVNGGAIYCDGESCIFINLSTIENNFTRVPDYPITSGGGIYCNTGSCAYIKQSTFNNNSATMGGGIFCEKNVKLTLLDSTISTNSAEDGGGIYSQGSVINDDFTSPLSIINSTIADNNASEIGGAVYSMWNSSVIILATTITKNNRGIPGGIFIESNHIVLVDSILINNTADDYQSKYADALIYGTADSAFSCQFISTWYDHTKTQAASITQSTNFPNLDQPYDGSLEPLADNGGPTKTVGLEPKCPASNRPILEISFQKTDIPGIYDMIADSGTSPFEKVVHVYFPNKQVGNNFTLTTDERLHAIKNFNNASFGSYQLNQPSNQYNRIIRL